MKMILAASGIILKDKKILLVDLDPQGNIDLSLQARAQYNIYDAMTGKVPLQQCIVHLAQNFDVISSTESLTKAEYYLYNQKESKMLLKELLGTITGYDFIILDCPPSLGILNQNALAFCKEVFVPTSADFLGFDALKKMKVIVTKINESYNNNCKYINTHKDHPIVGFFAHFSTKSLNLTRVLISPPSKSIFILSTEV